MASGTMRLDRQRMTRRAHVRKNSRQYRRGYKVLPHEVWGDTAKPPSTGGVSPPATGATAGTPGTWTPTGGQPPASVANLAAGIPVVVTASPLTPWTTGQYVQTRTTGTTGRASWSGTNWVGGAAPLEEDEHVINPGNFTIPDIEAWVDANPDLADEVLAHEQARSTPRVTLVDWLQGFISHRDEGTTP
jgi:hypothetical protein